MQPQTAKTTVEIATKIPENQTEPQDISPVKTFLLSQMKNLREIRKISAAENNKLFKTQMKALIDAGMAPNKKLDDYTIDEAKALIMNMFEKFEPEGTEIKA